MLSRHPRCHATHVVTPPTLIRNPCCHVIHVVTPPVLSRRPCCHPYCHATPGVPKIDYQKKTSLICNALVSAGSICYTKPQIKPLQAKGMVDAAESDTTLVERVRARSKELKKTIDACPLTTPDMDAETRAATIKAQQAIQLTLGHFDIDGLAYKIGSQYRATVIDFCAYAVEMGLGRPIATGENVAAYIVDVVLVDGRRQHSKTGSRKDGGEVRACCHATHAVTPPVLSRHPCCHPCCHATHVVTPPVLPPVLSRRPGCHPCCHSTHVVTPPMLPPVLSRRPGCHPCCHAAHVATRVVTPPMLPPMLSRRCHPCCHADVCLQPHTSSGWERQSYIQHG
jgi:hypothetical protein